MFLLIIVPLRPDVLKKRVLSKNILKLLIVLFTPVINVFLWIVYLNTGDSHLLSKYTLDRRNKRICVFIYTIKANITVYIEMRLMSLMLKYCPMLI